MDDARRQSLQLESLKMLKEWSVWLIALQAALCAFLWNVLKTFAGANWFEKSVYVAWFAFSISLIIATVLVSRLPRQIEGLADAPAEGSVFTRRVVVVGLRIKLRTLLILEHTFFLLGVAFVIIHVVVQAIIHSGS
jgi:hypothetical protein